jgi:energy-coupling factor transporter ATP-binding protein EcfA2
MQNGIEIKQVTFSYQNGQPKLKNISIKIAKGSFCGITGINGSGKTTLGLLFNGLIPHEIPGKLTGDVFIDGINTRSHSVSYFTGKVGMLFQNPDFMLFNLTVAEEIAFGLKNFKLDNHKERVSDALKMVGLSGFEERDPQTLSLGEKQKLALACILALDTPYIVLDEPAAMLDYRGAINLYHVLESLNRKSKKTIIVIEHDTDFLLAHTSQTIILNYGEILIYGDTRLVFSKTEPLKRLGIKIPQKIR